MVCLFQPAPVWLRCIALVGFMVSLPGCGGCGSPKINRLKQGYVRDDEEEAPAVAQTPPANPAVNPASILPGGAPVAAPTPSPAPPQPAKPIELPAGGAEHLALMPLDKSRTIDVVEARHHTLQRMKKISLAIGDYVRQHNRYPSSAIYNPDKYPLLSWRVHLLPYLGHDALYRRFNLNEPWNGEQNKLLIGEIPAVFQSPERGDSKTNYLLVTGLETVFPGVAGVLPQDITDGLANTVMMVEVNDEQAVIWTQPIDLAYAPENDPRRGLDGLRDDGFFLAWANGSLGRIPPDGDPQLLRPMFTRAGKETFAGTSISKPAVAEVDPLFADRHKSKRAVATVATPTTPAVASTGTTGSPSVTNPAGSSSNQNQRLPVPDEESQKKSMELFREIYREQYENAKSIPQKHEFARKLLDQAGKLTADPAGRYSLLKAAITIASDIGDVTTAMNATEQVISVFDARPFDLRCQVLLKAGKQAPLTKPCNDKLVVVGEELLNLALEEDNFPLALELHTLAVAAARRGKDSIKADEIAGRRREIELARLTYAKVEKVVDSLKDDPDDPDSNLTVGRYLCFIKRNWDRGLPMLAVGSDDGLKRLARQELRLPTAPEEQVALADAWWELAEREKLKDTTRRELTLRAVHWYLIALPRLPAGLLQVKTEVRVKEAERMWGKDAVDTIRVAQKGKVG